LAIPFHPEYAVTSIFNAHTVNLYEAGL